MKVLLICPPLGDAGLVSWSAAFPFRVADRDATRCCQEGHPRPDKTEAWLSGLDAKYPDQQMRWRTTIWKSTGICISRKGDALVLAGARGLAPASVRLPDNLLALPAAAFLEARLVQALEALPGSVGFACLDISLPFGPERFVGGAHLAEDTARHLQQETVRRANLLGKIVMQALAIGGLAMHEGILARLMEPRRDRPVGSGAPGGCGYPRPQSS